MRTIKLKSNGTGRYDDVSPFIITDNRLELKIDLPNFNGEFYLIAENNGKTFEKLLPRDGCVQLTELTAGELNTEVKHYLKGVLIKPYKIEPLILREADCKLSGTPELISLQESIVRLENVLEEYKRSAEKRITRLEKNVYALIKFAFKDYENNVYLGGGSNEEFIAEFGLELTDEELELIKGENENVD